MQVQLELHQQYINNPDFALNANMILILAFVPIITMDKAVDKLRDTSFLTICNQRWTTLRIRMLGGLIADEETPLIIPIIKLRQQMDAYRQNCHLEPN